ncbi:hypothetical protein AVEN_72123-1 [Araneus ventricosus]|uniref:Uncharacterized protein n=1 Tax=Araneus ventricosus TaxID=182803 RepID=A0A4Y2IYV2_ARAVE|nr:hypothetical protein AVEN_72123-1 [Araneus ventricosus]
MSEQYAQAANKHMMKIGSSVDYVRSGGMRNVPVTKAVAHLYETTSQLSGCVLLASRPTHSYPPRRVLTSPVLYPVSQCNCQQRSEEVSREEAL